MSLRFAVFKAEREREMGAFTSCKPKERERERERLAGLANEVEEEGATGRWGGGRG